MESLSNLYALADFRSLQPSADAVGWLTDVAELARSDPGIAATLGPAGLAFGKGFHERIKFGADSTSLLCAALSNCVAEHQLSVALEVPAAAPHLPLLLAAGFLLGTTTLAKLTRQPAGPAALKESGVLLVSSDLDLRLKYLRLFSDEAREKTYPGLRMNRRGRVETIGAGRKRLNVSADDQAAFTGLCFFYPGKQLPDSFEFVPKTVIVDARYGRLTSKLAQLIPWVEQIPHAGKLYLFTYRDIQADRVIQGCSIPQFPFDIQALATIREQISYQRASPTYAFDCCLSDALRYTNRTNDIKAASSEAALPKMLLRCEALLQDAGDNQDRALHRARWLLSTLRHLPVPTKYFDDATGMLNRWSFKKLLGTLDYISKDNRYAPVIQSLKVLLEQAYLGAYETCEKEAMLKDAIEEAFLSQDSAIGILCRDPTSRKAIEIWLTRQYSRDIDVLERVSVVTYRDLYKEHAPRFGITVISGLLSPFDHGWLYDADLGSTCTFLGYDYEEARLRERIALSRDKATCLGATRRRYALLRSLGRLNMTDTGAETPLAPVVINDGASISTPDTSDQPPRKERLKTIGRDFASLHLLMNQPFDGDRDKVEAASAPVPYEDQCDDVAALKGSSRYEDDDEVRARLLLVKVDGLEYDLYLDEERNYEVIREAKHGDEALGMLSPHEMRQGDTLLLTDSAERTNIFEQILAMLESDPEMKPLASIRRSWQNVILRLRDQYSDMGAVQIPKLLTDLRTHGAPIESEATIRAWIKGSVIGPGSVRSIGAVAHLTRSGDMIKRPQEYDDAFRQIRSIHRALGRRINALIRDAKLEISGTEDQNVPDDAFELPLRELMQSVEPVTIAVVSDVVEQRPGKDIQKLLPHGNLAEKARFDG